MLNGSTPKQPDGAADDVLYAVSKCKSDTGRGPKVVAINIPRSTDVNELDYSLLERVKVCDLPAREWRCVA
jgi:hypothetical protein